MTTNIVGSRMSANNSYGQNGASNPSSDLPGQSTRIAGLSTPAGKPVNGQLRDVTGNVADHPHMRRLR